MARFTTDYQPDRRGDPIKAVKAREDKRFMTDALILALKRKSADADGKPTRMMNLIAARLAKNAADGDNTAIGMVYDRTEGRPVQAIAAEIEHKGHVSFEMVIHRKKGENDDETDK